MSYEAIKEGDGVTLVMYQPSTDVIKLYHGGYRDVHWLGEPYLAWMTIETALSYGWEVIGEL